MKLLILGATGNTGAKLVSMALEDGHAVTGYVRNREKLKDVLPDAVSRMNVIEADLADANAIAAAMNGQDVVINAAGNAQDGPSYRKLVSAIIDAADEAMSPGARFWLFGGAAVLDVPGTDFNMLRFRQMPKVFQAHAQNISQVQDTDLDWSMLCPGPMIDSKNGKPHDALRISANTWPIPRPAFTRWLPKFSLLIAFIRRMPEMTITYEDAARVILDNLDTSGPYSKSRVGIALAKGHKLHKKNAIKHGN